MSGAHTHRDNMARHAPAYTRTKSKTHTCARRHTQARAHTQGMTDGELKVFQPDWHSAEVRVRGLGFGVRVRVRG